MEHPLVDAIGHPTGRLIERREPYALDIEQVMEAAVRTGTFLEINANPDRRDLNESNARLAAEAGAMLVIDSDAHGVDTLVEHPLRRGHGAARRGCGPSRWRTRASGPSWTACECGSSRGRVAGEALEVLAGEPGLWPARAGCRACDSPASGSAASGLNGGVRSM